MPGMGGGAGGVGGMMGGIDNAMSEAAGWISVVKQIWGTIFGAVGGLIQGSMALTLAAQSFKDDALDSFEILLGGEKAANDAYDKVIKLSHQLGLSREKAISETKRLLSAGYDMKDVPRMLEAIADLDMTREGGGAKLEKIIETIKAKGKLDKGAISQLTKLGIGEDDVYKRLAQSQHKTVDEVKALVKTGQIDAKTGIDAVLGSVEGKFGGRAKKDAEDVVTLLMTIKSQLFELFDSVDITPLQSVLKSVRDMLDSDLGKGMKDALTEMMGAMFEAIFGPLKDGNAMEGIVKGVTGAIKGITEFIKSATPSIRAFITQFIAGFSKMGPIMSVAWTIAGKFLSFLVSLAPLAAIIGRALGLIAGVIVSLMAAIAVFTGMLGTALAVVVGFTSAVVVYLEMMVSAAWGALNGAIDAVLGWIDTIFGAYDAARGAGGSIIDGLVAGIEAGADSVAAAVINAASNAIKAAKRILGIASPSKVFEEIGGYTAEGMEQGIDGGAAGVVGAVDRMGKAAAGTAIKIPRATADGAAKSDAANGNAGGGGDTYYVEVHANDTAGGEAAADAFQKRMIEFKRNRVAEG